MSFGTACTSCPLRHRCTTAKDGRSMTIHPHENLLRAARAQVRTPEFKQAYPTRSTIERIIAWTATQHGRRIKLRYLGIAQQPRLAPHPMRRDQPAHPPQTRPDPPEWGLGPGLTDSSASSPLAGIRTPSQTAIGGNNDHVVDPRGLTQLPQRRPCRRSSRPDPCLVQCTPRRARGGAGTGAGAGGRAAPHRSTTQSHWRNIVRGRDRRSRLRHRCSGRGRFGRRRDGAGGHRRRGGSGSRDRGPTTTRLVQLYSRVGG